MIRTQVSLPEELHAALRRKAFEEHRSLSAVVREILSASLMPEPRDKGPFGFTFIGMGKGGAPDVARRHDDYLAEEDRW
jgi:hypothetical protein